LPFIDSVTTERSKINEYINLTLHLQEFSTVNAKGAILNGKIPARFRAVLLPVKLFLMAKTISKKSAVPDKKMKDKNLTSYT